MPGGRPPGSTTAKTRQQQADRDDPDGLKRAALKANFFSRHHPSAHHSETNPGASSGQKADVDMGDIANSSDTLAASSSHEQSLEIVSAPQLPPMRQRVEGTLYTSKDGRVGCWNASAKELLCVCTPDSSSLSCAGNVKLRRCNRAGRNVAATGATNVLLGKRWVHDVNYRALDSDGTTEHGPSGNESGSGCMRLR